MQISRWLLSLALIAAMLASGCTLPPPPIQEAPTAPTAPTPTVPTTESVESSPVSEPASDPEQAVLGHPAGLWEGTLTIADMELEIAVEFDAIDAELAATLDIPAQNVSGLSLHDIRYESPTVHFEMLSGPQLGVFDGELQPDGSISGTFTQSGFEGTFHLQPAAPLATPAAPATADTYADPAGRFTVPIPTNWTAAAKDGYAVLASPGESIKVYLLTVDGEDIETAVADAWAIVDPEFDFEIDDVLEPPASGDLEKVVVVNYDLGESPERIVQALGMLHEGITYLMLFDGELIALQQRASQLGIIQSGFKITAVEEIDLSDAEPLDLDDEMIAALEAYIVEAMQQFEVPGAAISIVQDDRIVYANGFGVRNPETGEPVTSATRMMIGSTGKTMTTMLMAILVDQGLMDWDTAVVEILPNFAVADPELTQQITVRNLVCACTGVPRRDYELIFNADSMSAEDVIQSLSTFEFFTDFGEAFQYSNQMVATGGYVAAAAAGGEYGELFDAYARALQEYVLDPIGLVQTSLSMQAVQASGNYAVPYGLNLAGEYAPIPLSIEELLTPIMPAGGHWSTVEDMARYLLTELNRGIGPDGNRVISAENLAVTWEPQVPIAADTSYGLGWIVDEYKGQPLIHHGGNTFGFTSDLAFLPDVGLGISILTNGRGTNFFNEAVRYRLLEMVFQQELESETQVAYALQRMKESYAELNEKLLEQADADAVTPFLGRYTNELLGEMVLTLQDGVLIADAGEFQSELRPHLDDEGVVKDYLTFTPPLAGETVKLQSDDDGNQVLVLGSGVTEYVFHRTE